MSDDLVRVVVKPTAQLLHGGGVLKRGALLMVGDWPNGEIYEVRWFGNVEEDGTMRLTLRKKRYAA